MRWLWAIISVPYFLIVLLALMLVVNSFIPLGFWTDCSFTNKTDSPVFITPVGTVGRAGHRCSLPLYRNHSFFSAIQCGNFRVEPGKTFRFSYDMDDVNFSEVVVKHSNGESGQFIANPNPTQNQYISPEVTDFTLNNVSELVDVPPNVKAVADDPRRGPGARFWIGYVPLAIVIFELCRILTVKYRKRAASTIATQATLSPATEPASHRSPDQDQNFG